MVYVVVDMFQGIVNDVRVYARRKDAMAEIRWLIQHTGEKPDKEASHPERGYWSIGEDYEFRLVECPLHRGPATGP